MTNPIQWARNAWACLRNDPWWDVADEPDLPLRCAWCGRTPRDHRRG